MKNQAPWNLRGEGYILLYKNCAVMLVNYHETSVGPYKELLFIPGRLILKSKGYSRITRIYVSTRKSMLSGRTNWGLPKELGEFRFRRENKNTEKIIVRKNKGLVLKAKFKSSWFRVLFPISTKIISINLLQEYKDKRFKTRIRARGKVRLTKLLELKTSHKHFPDISKQKPLCVIRVEAFRMLLEKPEITKVLK